MQTCVMGESASETAAAMQLLVLDASVQPNAANCDGQAACTFVGLTAVRSYTMPPNAATMALLAVKPCHCTSRAG